jgi:hypothetical protein
MIAAAAIRKGDRVYTLPPPARHHDIIRLIAEETAERPAVTEQDTQGFVTNEGRFVNRRQAVLVAIRAGQIERPKWPGGLYSEDLW